MKKYEDKKSQLLIQARYFIGTSLEAKKSASSKIYTFIGSICFLLVIFFIFAFSSLLLHLKKIMPNIVLLNIFPTVRNLLRLRNSFESNRQKRTDFRETNFQPALEAYYQGVCDYMISTLS